MIIAMYKGKYYNVIVCYIHVLSLMLLAKCST